VVAKAISARVWLIEPAISTCASGLIFIDRAFGPHCLIGVNPAAAYNRQVAATLLVHAANTAPSSSIFSPRARMLPKLARTELFGIMPQRVVAHQCWVAASILSDELQWTGTIT
jgi:hypothetical protein